MPKLYTYEILMSGAGYRKWLTVQAKNIREANQQAKDYCEGIEENQGLLTDSLRFTLVKRHEAKS